MLRKQSATSYIYQAVPSHYRCRRSGLPGTLPILAESGSTFLQDPDSAPQGVQLTFRCKNRQQLIFEILELPPLILIEYAIKVQPIGPALRSSINQAAKHPDWLKGGMDAQRDTRRIERVMLACVACRSRHVKCDSNQPICNRCRRDGKECVYQKSRRGGLTKEALARRRLRLQQEAEQSEQRSEELQEAPESSSQATPLSSSHGNEPMYSEYLNLPTMESLHLLEGQPSASTTLSFEINDDRILELFYEYFWPAFPVVIPLQFYQARRMQPDHGLVDLSLVLEWIGSIYASWCPTEPYYQAALEAMTSPLLPRTPFTVQALMLFAVAQHHQDMRPESRKSLDHAILIALELDMNKRDFARSYGEGNPVLEESWRRTWYILSVTDQHFAIVMNSPIYQLAQMPSDVDLPCDDEFFEAGVSPRLPVHTF